MSRRDTVIIAVLINAGILIVLLATAIKSGDSGKELAYEPSSSMPIATVSELPIRPEPAKAAGDEVDQVLNSYTHPIAAAPSAAPSVSAVASSAPAHREPAKTSSFADDLQAITLPPAIPTTVVQHVPSGNYAEIAVKKGDVLEKIARVHGTSVEEIMRANQLTTTRLKIGQVLRIPAKNSAQKLETAAPALKPAAAPALKPAAAPVKNSPSAPKFYTVKNGDNPWTIAVKNHMKVDELLKLNNLDEEKARRLKPGDQLRIR